MLLVVLLLYLLHILLKLCNEIKSLLKQTFGFILINLRVTLLLLDLLNNNLCLILYISRLRDDCSWTCWWRWGGRNDTSMVCCPWKTVRLPTTDRGRHLIFLHIITFSEELIITEVNAIREELFPILIHRFTCCGSHYLLLVYLLLKNYILYMFQASVINSWLL